MITFVQLLFIMPRTSIIILNWNGLSLLKKFLPSVTADATCSDAVIIVADNGSDDGSLAYINENYPQVQVIAFDRNYGFTLGYNMAMERLDTEYAVLLNSDVEVRAGWLPPLIAMLDADASIAACMPKILSYNRPTHFEYAGAAGGFIDALGYPFCRGRILDNIEADNGQYDEPRMVFWASGACMLVRTEVYKRLGGLDECFFAHMEEIDLCWRMHSAGYSVWCNPYSVVYHVGGGTLPNDNPRKLYYNYRNNLLMLYKNLPALHFRLMAMLRFGMDALSALLFLLKGKPSFCMAVARAYAHFFRMRSGRRLMSAMRHDAKHGVCGGSIVVSYFLLRRKAFTQLNYANK